MNFRIMTIVVAILNSINLLSQEIKLIENKFYDSKQIQERYSVLKSDKQIKHGEYVSYFKMNPDQARNFKDGIYKLEQFIRTKGAYKNGKKDGEWLEYDRPFSLKTKGKYVENKKVGVWATTKENGQVIENFDHDLKKMLPPIIKVNIDYPPRAREMGIQGGLVGYSYRINKDCSISDVKITKSFNEEFDNHVIAVLKRISELQMRYSMICEEKIVSQDIVFKLE
jgi:Gram-negative bacterial TonB protein C-terminal